MVTSTLRPTPGTPYFNFTLVLQWFYAARGMWVDDKPRGLLTAMLGPQAPMEISTGKVFFMTGEQIGMMLRDLSDNGLRGLTKRQLAQSQRRLLEALRRSGSVPADVPCSTRVEGPRPSLDSASHPFEPLRIPTERKARKAFENHAMSCLRAVVDYSQQADYMASFGQAALRDG
ncbi:hypothetical protein SNE35_18730 [Paucibacter sp. R3-3]|uniref:Uncharacterized protein n=1 Tax=Roseateles agri TaxID=3098619 RepID=A0ABU5DJU3_9BURK|nr:hypothetical protein [Paucibacter sp. R3-3]MDY0746556.1 hypothetical protein [Paucibacter sp. R3-3]